MANHIVLVLTAEPTGGGKFQYSLAILDAVCSFSELDFRTSIIYFSDQWRKYLQSARCNVYKCKKGIIGRALGKVLLYFPFGLKLWREINKYIHPFHRLLNRLKPDLVIYPGNDAYVYETNLLGIASIFDLMHRYEPSFPEVSANGLREKRDRHYQKVCEYARAILVDSEMGKEHVISCYKVEPRKIFVLPYVAPRYVFRYKGEFEILKKYHLPQRYIFYPAQLWKHKNHIGLLRALSLLRQKNILVNAVFAGGRENGAQEFFKEIEHLGLADQVSYLEYVSDEEMVSLYKNAVALVMPTFFGPTNIPQVEAFALGCPVLTSNVYAIPEQVGDAALLFDPHNVADIANKVKLIWKDDELRKRLIEKGYKRNSEWNQAAFNSMLLSIIQDIL